MSRKMDVVVLPRFLVSKRNESAPLRVEIVVVMEEAVDPAWLVVEAVEEFVKIKVVEFLQMLVVAIIVQNDIVNTF